MGEGGGGRWSPPKAPDEKHGSAYRTVNRDEDQGGKGDARFQEMKSKMRELLKKEGVDGDSWKKIKGKMKMIFSEADNKEAGVMDVIKNSRRVVKEGNKVLFPSSKNERMKPNGDRNSPALHGTVHVDNMEVLSEHGDLDMQGNVHTGVVGGISENSSAESQGRGASSADSRNK